ncbi:MAG TPA: sulfatase [Phycisphaerae bacterium]|nr:sulfatase [Phycisphaerae bacterium]HPP27935.1 sulfatase [Phycisphaerae bacterium]
MTSPLMLLSLMSAAALPGDAAHWARPNILVILCDDLGYGDLACYGHPVIRTPHLDRLAAQGMRLTSCYSAAPVCSPSRAGLLTGRNPNRFGVYDWIPGNSPMHMGRNEITLAQLLKQAGYATCHVGKWHCNGMFNRADQPQPNDHGFDHWFSTQNNAAPDHHNPTNFVRNGKPVGPTEGYSCQVVTDEAIAWLRDQPADKPFFQFVCFHEPHEPVASPMELVSQYADENANRAQYYANVSNIDAAVGRLMAALDELNLADRTFVLFTSDNGPETLERYPRGTRCYGSPGPLRGMKLHIYEGGIRVPGIIRWPGRIAAGTISDEPVCSVDLLPTFCTLAGVQPPRDRPLDGASLLPLLVAGQPIMREKPLFWLYHVALSEPKLALREGDWKLCAHWDVPPDALKQGAAHPDTIAALKRAKLVKYELYNLREDIGENNDLAASEPQRVEAMANQLKNLLAEIQKNCPVWPAAPDRRTK